jgi:hypothetical protein
MLILKSKYPLFPKEYSTKLYTTDGDNFFVDFNNSKFEIVNGASVLKLINGIC